MEELIILICSHLIMWVLGLKIGLGFIAEDLHNMGIIGVIELDYMRSWRYLYDAILATSERNG